MKEVDIYSRRLKLLEDFGFIQKNGCISNGKYAFLYHQIDIDAMTEEQFTEFINIVKLETNENTQRDIS